RRRRMLRRGMGRLAPVAGLRIVLAALLAAGAVAACATAARIVPQAAPRADTSDGAITLDGRPVFLIGSWGQCAADVDRNLALGVNPFVGSLCDERALSDRIDGRAWMIQSISTDTTLSSSIGYLQPDEPDVNGIPPTALQAPRGNGKLTLVDVSMDF